MKNIVSGENFHIGPHENRKIFGEKSDHSFDHFSLSSKNDFYFTIRTAISFIFVYCGSDSVLRMRPCLLQKSSKHSTASVFSDQNGRKPILKIDRNRRGNGLIIINIDFDQLHTEHLATNLRNWYYISLFFQSNHSSASSVLMRFFIFCFVTSKLTFTRYFINSSFASGRRTETQWFLFI